jgi:hypothetical protein
MLIHRKNIHLKWKEIFMTEDLQNKLKKSQDLKAIQELFLHINGLEVIEYDNQNQDFSSAEEKLKEIRQIASISNSSISIETDMDSFTDWVKAIMNQSIIISPFYIRLADFYAAGWIQVKFDNLHESLLSIWDLLTIKNIEIVQQNLSNVLVLSQEEYKIEAHWK